MSPPLEASLKVGGRVSKEFFKWFLTLFLPLPHMMMAGVLDLLGGGVQAFLNQYNLTNPKKSATEFGLCPGEIEKLLEKIKPEKENRHLELTKK